MSVILGTVAFSYGSVPFYKMVSLFSPAYHSTTSPDESGLMIAPGIDMPDNRLGWSASTGAQ